MMEPSLDTPNATSHTADFEFDALNEARNYRAALLAEFRPYLRGHVVEVGAGIGQFSQAIRTFPKVVSLVAVEPEARFCRQYRALHPDGVLVEGIIDDLPPGPDRDAVLSVNVLEHIREDTAELAKYHRLLAAKGGHLCLFVPARPEIYAPIDADFGHFRRYVREDLGATLRRVGFEVVSLHYFNCVGYLAWWLYFCALKKRHFTIPSVRFFDRVIFPAVHWAESRLVRPPIGQSLIVVARALPAG